MTFRFSMLIKAYSKAFSEQSLQHLTRGLMTELRTVCDETRRKSIVVIDEY